MWSDCYFWRHSDHFYKRRIIPCHHSHWASRKRGDYETNPRCQERYSLFYSIMCLLKQFSLTGSYFKAIRAKLPHSQRELLAIYEGPKEQSWKSVNKVLSFYSGLLSSFRTVYPFYYMKLSRETRECNGISCRDTPPPMFTNKIGDIYILDWFLIPIHLISVRNRCYKGPTSGRTNPRFRLQRTRCRWCRLLMQAELSQWYCYDEVITGF